MKYFISHSSKDKSIADRFVKIVECNEPEIIREKKLFYSSVPENGSDFKEELITNINVNISKAENILLIITENYLRSAFCFYELSLARYLKNADRKIILIVQNESVAARIDDIFPSKSFLHINAMLENAPATLARSLGYSFGHAAKSDVLLTDFFASLQDGMQAVGTPFIGMSSKTYGLKYQFLEQYGIEKLGFDYPATPEIMDKKLTDAQEIYFVSTTGSGFLKTYKDILTSKIGNGCALSLVVGDKESAFCMDVADIEALGAASGYEQLKENNYIRITSEFQATFQYLNEIHAAAQKTGTAGKIRCGSSYTLIRQTAFIAKRRDGSYWGWITCTMPPVRSADQTPSIVFEGDSDNTLVNDVWKYVTSLFSLAQKKGGTVDIDGSHVPEKLDPGSTNKGFVEMLKNSEAYWEERYAAAQKYMAMCEDRFDGILIEVAAQHPLKKGTVPNKEFEARLNKAIELYEKYTNAGETVIIYVPGSRHKYNGVADQLSLSQAGVNYLQNKGIPAECLLGEQANEQYKGEYGVYNSADECYVASEIFKNGQFEKLICICSPYQVMRKTMLYIEFGCIPLCFGVTTEKMFHKNVVDEIFHSLNHVLYVDHSWQDETSAWFQYFRDTRKP